MTIQMRDDFLLFIQTLDSLSFGSVTIERLKVDDKSPFKPMHTLFNILKLSTKIKVHSLVDGIRDKAIVDLPNLV